MKYLKSIPSDIKNHVLNFLIRLYVKDPRPSSTSNLQGSNVVTVMMMRARRSTVKRIAVGKRA